MDKPEYRIAGGCTLWARHTIDSEVFAKKPPKWFKIWFYIVSRANHRDNAGLKRGQCHLSYEIIMLKCSAKRAEVDHCIRWLKNCRMLATRKATRGFVLTVLNYRLYQNMENYKSDSKSDSKATQKRQDKQEWKNEDKKTRSPLRQIFDHWNSYKGRSVRKQDKDGNEKAVTWHSHKLRTDGSISRDVADAIREALRDGYSADDVCAAIENYALVLLGPDYWWSYPWTLPEFLSRREEKHKAAARKWWRFLPDNFDDDKYLNTEAARKRQAQAQGPGVYSQVKETLKGLTLDEQEKTA